LGQRLREERQSRGWAVWEMARRLREAATASGDPNVPSSNAITRNIRRWESGIGGVSERYRLYYSKALGIAAAELEPDPAAGRARADDEQPSAASRQWVAAVLRDIRDGLRDDAKQCQARAEQVAPDPVRAALCRGQALGYAAAAEQIDAAAAYTTMLPRPDAALLHR